MGFNGFLTLFGIFLTFYLFMIGRVFFLFLFFRICFMEYPFYYSRRISNSAHRLLLNPFVLCTCLCCPSSYSRFISPDRGNPSGARQLNDCPISHDSGIVCLFGRAVPGVGGRIRRVRYHPGGGLDFPWGWGDEGQWNGEKAYFGLLLVSMHISID